METYTITEDKLNLLAFNLKKEASLHTCDLILQIIDGIRQPVEEDFEYSISNYGIKTEQALELGGKLESIRKVIDEIVIFKTSIDETIFKAN